MKARLPGQYPNKQQLFPNNSTTYSLNLALGHFLREWAGYKGCKDQKGVRKNEWIRSEFCNCSGCRELKN